MTLVRPCSCVICTNAVLGDGSLCPYYEDCDADVQANRLRLDLIELEDLAWRQYAEAYARGEL
jgi:hypothetical protein